MLITINGLKKEVKTGLSIRAVLESEGHAGKPVAVAHNGSFAPRAAHADTIVNEGDALEILAPMEGG